MCLLSKFVLLIRLYFIHLVCKKIAVLVVMFLFWMTVVFIGLLFIEAFLEIEEFLFHMLFFCFSFAANGIE